MGMCKSCYLLMTRRLPRSTLFPYTRSSDLLRLRHLELLLAAFAVKISVGLLGTTHAQAAHRDLDRSEEHTSELQSHSDLVCRLLLEKKKKDRSNAPSNSDHQLPDARIIKR